MPRCAEIRDCARETERGRFCSSDGRTIDAAVGDPIPCWCGVSPLYEFVAS